MKFLKKKTETVLNFLVKYLYIIYMMIPFVIMDLFTRISSYKINFFAFYRLVPNLFSLIWILFFVLISLSFKKKIGKIIYLFFFVLAFCAFMVNNIYYSMTNNFFDFILMESLGEGSPYLLDSLMQASIWIYVVAFISILSAIWAVFKFKGGTFNYKLLLITSSLFVGCHFIIPLLLGKENIELTFNTWRNPRNVYINFNDSNKSMSLSGLYEYTFRNFYITFIKQKKTDNEVELAFLDDIFSVGKYNEKNNYTGIFKGNNVIFIQLEGIDNWLLEKDVMPNLYGLMDNSINFVNHYSYYNGGGSTFNSEFAVNTGFIAPISYTQNAYSFNKNSFDYSLPRLLKKNGYSVNAFHMNTSEYYSRGVNYKNWGYDNYYGLRDLAEYTDNTYTLDTELINNSTFYEKMFLQKGNFAHYLITYSNHMPFDTEKGVCKTLHDRDLEQDLVDPEAILTEEDCIKRQARETDDMIGLLIKALEDNNLSDNTFLVIYSDHYLYTISDSNILDKYKNTSNNLINETPFFIYKKGLKKKVINDVTSQINILPTVLNLFGIEYNPIHYTGMDALSNNYNPIVFFNDYSWYDGNVYVEGDTISGNIIEDELEEKNNYVNYLIKKNDLILKSNYFKLLSDRLKENNDK